ncbi:MAG: hypothetical protein HY953_05070 [Candidatus Rokubacteria bacterium]|nr:hypothetical protein [Candidatus Rokubacteria bacterium]
MSGCDAPVPEARPTYVGLGTTLMAPAAGALDLALLVWRVSDPRHLARAEM